MLNGLITKDPSMTKSALMFCEKNVSGEIYSLPDETEYPVVIGIEPEVQKTYRINIVSKSP